MNGDARDDRALAETWLRYARSDEASAAVLLEERRSGAAGICFLAQQIAEKCLKALLVARTGEYVRTHDFGKLLEHLDRVVPGIEATLRDATSVLDPYYVGTRYPADLPIESLTWNDAESAFNAAQTIKNFVLIQINRSDDAASRIAT